MLLINKKKLEEILAFWVIKIDLKKTYSKYIFAKQF